MAEKKDTNKYWIMVPRVGEAVPNVQIMGYQKLAVVENGIQVTPARTRVLEPNGQGLFAIDSAQDDFGLCATRMEQHMEFANKKGKAPRLLGPFDTRSDAFKAMHEARPKTDTERANEAVSKAANLEQDNAAKTKELEAKDKELQELRARIAKSGQGSKA